MTPNWPCIPMRSTLQTIKTYHWGWNFGPFCSTTTGFWDIRFPENRKWTEWSQTELEHLTVKITLYLNTYPWGPNFGPFHSTISHFRDTCTRSAKIGNAPNDPTLNLNTNSQRYYIYSRYTLNTYPWGPNFGPFNSTISRFRGKCTEGPQTELEYLAVKSTLYTLSTYPWGPNFGPCRSMTSR